MYLFYGNCHRLLCIEYQHIIHAYTCTFVISLYEQFETKVSYLYLLTYFLSFLITYTDAETMLGNTAVYLSTEIYISPESWTNIYIYIYFIHLVQQTQVHSKKTESIVLIRSQIMLNHFDSSFNYSTVRRIPVSHGCWLSRSLHVLISEILDHLSIV